MRLKLVILVLFSLLLTACASNFIYEEYQVLASEPLAEVKFIALDEYRNGDAVIVSLLTRKDCKSKYLSQEVARLEVVFLGDDKYSSSNWLPANKVLALQIVNISDSGFVVARCANLKGFQFEASKKYAFEVNNWSTKSDRKSPFGCDAAVFEVDQNGEHISQLRESNLELPVCNN